MKPDSSCYTASAALSQSDRWLAFLALCGRSEWPRPLETGAVMIRDLSGDLYQIKDPTALDPAGQKLVWAYME